MPRDNWETLILASAEHTNKVSVTIAMLEIDRLSFHNLIALKKVIINQEVLLRMYNWTSKKILMPHFF